MTLTTTLAGNASAAGGYEAGAAARQVRHFYTCVDGGDAPALAALFATGAVYQRPGYRDYHGPEGLLRFYTADRAIRDGAHTLRRIVVEGDDIAVVGDFHGTAHSGAPVDLRFADYFHLTPDGLFDRRETYFFAPLT